MKNADSANRVLEQIHGYMKQHYNQVNGGHYEMNFNDFEAQAMLDHSFTMADVNWYCSDDDREHTLMRLAKQKHDEMIERRRAKYGVVV